ncbi:adenylate/guanylate cyclase domain-containing protein [Rhodoblastus sp.]|uniref:adenylate/guanylate cyclase domain-containing protein n=1 Tax=Rhodoblastus sp. TaxID=1962975 RepID=UPI003F9DD67B
MIVRPQLSFTVTILIAFTLVFAFVLGLAVLGFRSAGERAAVATADVNLAQVATTVSGRTNALVLPVLALIREVADTGIAADTTGNVQAGARLLAMLAAGPEVRTVSVAWPDGSLLQAAPVSVAPAAAMPAPPNEAAYVLCFSRPDAPVKTWTFFVADRTPISSAMFGRPGDPRRTQWYLQARKPGVYISTPYTLGLSQRVGLSVSSQQAGGGVLSLDITLASLSAFLRAQRITPHTLAFLFSDLGILLAYPDDTRAVGEAGGGRVSWTTLQASDDPVLGAVWNAYASGQLGPGRGKLLSVDGTAMLARLESVESLENPPVLVAVVAPRSDFTAAVDASVRSGTLLALGAFLLGFAAIAFMSWRIARPLGVLTREAQSIRRFELAAPLVLRSRITEVERLAEAIAAMKATLSSFAIYLPRDLVRQFLAAGAEPQLGGERIALSVMFTDIQGFTTIAENLDPMELTHIASAYFEAVTRELLAAGATIDKYIGDSVMAFWNAPRRNPDHAAHACAGALRARAVTQHLTEAFAARGWPELWTRFGVHTGEAVVGNVGSSDRMAYTAMGGMVNLASRLEGLNKLYGTQILVSEATRAAAGPGFVFRPVDIVVVKGATSPMPVHELLGVTDAAAAPDLRARDAAIASLKTWEACVAAYREGRFDAARAALAEVQAAGMFPLAEIYAARLAELGSQAEPGWSPSVPWGVK